MWNKIASFILRRRVYLLIGITVFTALMTWQALKVEMDYHYTMMLPESDPAFQDNIKFKEIFGEEANGIIIGFEDKGIFELSEFKKLKILCDSIKTIPNVTNVLTIIDAYNLRTITTTDSTGKIDRKFETYQLFPKNINNQAELDSLKAVFFSLPIYEGLLYDKEKSTFLMTVSISKDILNTAERLPVVDKIKSFVDNYTETANVTAHVSGHPYIRSVMMVQTKHEIMILVILAAVICILILIIFYRNIKIIVTTVLIVGVAVACSLGVMGIMGYKFTILTAMVPPLLIVIAVPNCVYIFNKFYAESKNHGNKIKALHRVIVRIGASIFMTNFTTATGFLTFLITNNNYLIQFGIAAACGIMTIFVASIIIIPCCFCFWKLPSDKKLTRLDNVHTRKIVNFFVMLVSKHRTAVYIGFACLLGFAIFGITQIQRSGYILDDVKHSDPLYKDLKFLEAKFNGAFPLEILIESKDSITNLNFVEQVEKINELQTRLEKYPDISKSMSVANFAKFAYQAYSRGKAENYKLPPDLATYKKIFERMPKIENNLSKTFVDSTRRNARINLFINDLGTDKMDVLMPKLQAEIDTVFNMEKTFDENDNICYNKTKTSNYNTLITGSTVLYFISNKFLTVNLAQSIGLAIFIIVCLMLWMFRSPRMVLISIIPNLIPMLVTGGVMGIFGVPIKPSTLLVFSIVFSISIDDTIHFLSKFRQELRINNNVHEVCLISLKETGLSMIYTSIILVFGFLIFAFSGFGGTVALGVLVPAALFIATFSNLILLPSLILTFEKKLQKKYL